MITLTINQITLLVFAALCVGACLGLLTLALCHAARGTEQ